MAKSPNRKTIELLLKKIEALENQGFSQKLIIDDLENRLEQTERSLQQVKDSTSVTWSRLPPQSHLCTPGPIDTAGYSWCNTCGIQLTPKPIWTISSIY